MWIVYIFLCVLLLAAQSALNKVYQKNVPMTGITQSLYMLIVSIEACLLFFLMARGDIMGDIRAVQYGAVATLLVIGSMLSTLICMGHMNLAVLTVSQNAGSLVLPALYGFLVLGESVTWLKGLGLLLVMAAFIIPFVFRDQQQAGRMDRTGLLATVAVFVFSGACNIIHKAYTVSGSVASNEAYLTWLNIFMVPILLVSTLVVQRRSGKTFRQLTEGARFRYYLLVIAGVILGCVGMTASLAALALVDVSVYSPLYASLFIIFITLISRFVFRERVTKANYLSVALAIIAVILSVL